MPHGPSHLRRGWKPVSLVIGLAASIAATGCATLPRGYVRADRTQLHVELNPERHTISGVATIDLTREAGPAAQAGKPCEVWFRLHPDLRVSAAECRGATLTGWSQPIAHLSDEDKTPYRQLRLRLAAPSEAWSVTLRFDGTVWQDVAAGEVAGEIHNFQMRAHVGQEGIYLAGGYWYPEPDRAADAEPTLGHYTLTASAPGMELIASAETDPALRERTGQPSWRTPYPVDGMVLVGGPLKVFSARHGDIDIRVYLSPESEQLAESWIAAVKRNFDRYQPLLGPYPAREYSVVENFFSSGFAFPTFTLLSSAVIQMGERAQTSHGYLDHEILHCWWGNGVHVDPRDGNWCEALASYAANYYGHVLDGKDDEARRYRRNTSHFLSRLKPDEDKPLGTFGRDDGAGRSIGYQKGAMVFDMLAHRVGVEKFWRGLRKLNAEYLGRYAGWEDIQRIMEEESATGLGPFFQQWVRRGGAPELTADDASYNPQRGTVKFRVKQGEPVFAVRIPVRIYYGDSAADHEIGMDRTEATYSMPVPMAPAFIEIDPDYDLFRRMPPDVIVPTTAATREGKAFATVLPSGDVAAEYKAIAASFEKSFESNERVSLTAGSIAPGALAERCALVLGASVHDAYVSSFLSAVEFPIRFHEDGFEFEGRRYTSPSDAVLATAAHPGVPGGGITVVYANSEAAIPRAMLVPMYDRSIVIFANGMAKERKDLEKPQKIPVGTQ